MIGNSPIRRACAFAGHVGASQQNGLPGLSHLPMASFLMYQQNLQQQQQLAQQQQQQQQQQAQQRSPQHHTQDMAPPKAPSQEPEPAQPYVNPPHHEPPAEPRAAATASDRTAHSGGNAGNAGNLSDTPSLPAGTVLAQDKIDDRRKRRMLSNRESARRSRRRKQEQLQARPLCCFMCAESIRTGQKCLAVWSCARDDIGKLDVRAAAVLRRCCVTQTVHSVRINELMGVFVSSKFVTFKIIYNKRKNLCLQELEAAIEVLEKKGAGLESQCQAAAVHVQKLMADKQRLENENQHLLSIFSQLQVRVPASLCSFVCVQVCAWLRM